MIETQKDPAFEAIEWHGDPAASGYRYRAWVAGPSGETAELCAYERGVWCLGFPERQYQWFAEGLAPTLEEAMRLAFDAWLRLR